MGNTVTSQSRAGGHIVPLAPPQSPQHSRSLPRLEAGQQDAPPLLRRLHEAGQQGSVVVPQLGQQAQRADQQLRCHVVNPRQQPLCDELQGALHVLPVERRYRCVVLDEGQEAREGSPGTGRGREGLIQASSPGRDCVPSATITPPKCTPGIARERIMHLQLHLFCNSIYVQYRPNFRPVHTTQGPTPVVPSPIAASGHLDHLSQVVHVLCLFQLHHQHVVLGP